MANTLVDGSRLAQALRRTKDYIDSKATAGGGGSWYALNNPPAVTDGDDINIFTPATFPASDLGGTVRGVCLILGADTWYLPAVSTDGNTIDLGLMVFVDTLYRAVYTAGRITLLAIRQAPTARGNLQGTASGDITLFPQDPTQIRTVTPSGELFSTDVAAPTDTNSQWMLSGATTLRTISHFAVNLTAATTIRAMFLDCPNLTSLDMTATCAPNLTTITQTFGNCINLTTIKIPWLANCKLTQASWAFSGCRALTVIPCTFDFSEMQTAANFVRDCLTLETLRIKGFGTQKDLVTTNMFLNCNALSQASMLYILRDQSYNRAAAGYPALTVTLPSSRLALLSSANVSAIAAKGYTLTAQ